MLAEAGYVCYGNTGCGLWFQKFFLQNVGHFLETNFFRHDSYKKYQ